MQLKAMTEADYAFWAPRSRESYAEDKRRANDYTPEQARAIAEADFSRLLPQGLKSENNYLYAAFDGETRVGFLWFMKRGEGRAFVCDVIIEEAQRGRGFGKRMMQALEVEVRKLGLTRLGLHVFGFNEVAISLYRSLGYQTTDLVMEKDLD